MAKKASFRLLYNAPVSLSLVIASLLIFLLDTVAFKGNLIPAAFTCHGNSAADIPFNFAAPAEYVRLVTHSLGNASWESLLVSSIFILLLGPLMEERYGSPALALMTAVSALVAGVLNACLIPQELTGQSEIVFMLILLSSLAALEKKEMEISRVLLFIIFLAQQMHSAAQGFTSSTRLSNIAFIAFMQRNVGTFTTLAAGLCGSLFGFLVAPKAKKEGKTATFTATAQQNQGTRTRPMATPYDKPNPYDGTTSVTLTQDEVDRLERQSPRNKKRRNTKEEEIGTLKL